jgi:hypothetical protein
VSGDVGGADDPLAFFATPDWRSPVEPRLLEAEGDAEDRVVLGERFWRTAGDLALDGTAPWLAWGRDLWANGLPARPTGAFRDRPRLSRGLGAERERLLGARLSLFEAGPRRPGPSTALELSGNVGDRSLTLDLDHEVEPSGLEGPIS